jgi:hypothetical protein
MQIENQNTLLHAIKNGVNLFLGSGFSILAQNAQRLHLPTGSILAEELCEKFKVSKMAGLQLPQICTIIEHTQRAGKGVGKGKRGRSVLFDILIEMD